MCSYTTNYANPCAADEMRAAVKGIQSKWPNYRADESEPRQPEQDAQCNLLMSLQAMLLLARGIRAMAMILHLRISVPLKLEYG